MTNTIREKRIRRARRSRALITGSATRPRLCVFRSNKNLTLQLIDDNKGLTVVNASTKELKSSKSSKTEMAGAVGELLAKKALDTKITEAVFDRRFYKYHGRVKAAAEGARKGGLKI